MFGGLSPRGDGTGTLYVVCSTSALSEEFCHGLEMKFTSPLVGIQQAGALETAAKNVTPCFGY